MIKHPVYRQQSKSTHETIIIRDNPEAGQFEAHIGSDIAVAEYALMGNTIMFTHTEVPKHLEGRGIGSQLVREALESVKQRGMTVIPICAFVAAFIRKNPEYVDLVNFAHRTALYL